jgi:hypothetical protein
MIVDKEVVEFYQSLVFFQSRALAFVASSGKNREQMLGRIKTVLDLIGHLKTEDSLMFSFVYCPPGTVDCGGVCVPENMCAQEKKG